MKVTMNFLVFTGILLAALLSWTPLVAADEPAPDNQAEIQAMLEEAERAHREVERSKLIRAAQEALERGQVEDGLRWFDEAISLTADPRRRDEMEAKLLELQERHTAAELQAAVGREVPILLEEIGRVGEFDTKPGSGIAIQIDVEDAVGVTAQVEKLQEIVEDEL